MGGVTTGLDALELIAAGASAVALGTILFSDPDAPARIRSELAAEAAARDLGASPRSARRSLMNPCKWAFPVLTTGNGKRLETAQKRLLDRSPQGC